MAQKTNTGLIAYAKAQVGKPYWYGCYGQDATATLYDRKRSQYPQHYSSSDFASQYGQRVHDCIGLFKGYMWSSSAKSEPVYSIAQDKNVGGIKKQCSKTGNIKTIPAVPGIAVFIGTSHIGYYDGCGGVYEARGHAYGVVHTKLKERPWDAWGYLPWINYVAEKIEVSDYPVIRLGSRSEAVKKAQQILVSKGYKGRFFKSLKVDGIFGANTEYAVKKFQQKNGLVVDGIVGVKTWDKLING